METEHVQSLSTDVLRASHSAHSGSQPHCSGPPREVQPFPPAPLHLCPYRRPQLTPAHMDTSSNTAPRNPDSSHDPHLHSGRQALTHIMHACALRRTRSHSHRFLQQAYTHSSPETKGPLLSITSTPLHRLSTCRVAALLCWIGQRPLISTPMELPGFDTHAAQHMPCAARIKINTCPARSLRSPGGHPTHRTAMRSRPSYRSRHETLPRHRHVTNTYVSNDSMLWCSAMQSRRLLRLSVPRLHRHRHVRTLALP